MRYPCLRVLAATPGLLPLLTSCITARMWQGESRTDTTRLACDAAVACPAGPPTQPQVALRLDAESAAVLGTDASPVDHRFWVLLQLDGAAGFTDLLQHVRQGDAENVIFEVLFAPRAGMAPREASLQLRVLLRSSLQPIGVEDRRPARHAWQERSCSSHCRWQVQSTAPAGGEALAPPWVGVVDYRRVGLDTPAMVALTPITVACDVVLLPIELLATLAFWLAD